MLPAGTFCHAFCTVETRGCLLVRVVRTALLNYFMVYPDILNLVVLQSTLKYKI